MVLMTGFANQHLFYLQAQVLPDALKFSPDSSVENNAQEESLNDQKTILGHEMNVKLIEHKFKLFVVIAVVSVMTLLLLLGYFWLSNQQHRAEDIVHSAALTTIVYGTIGLSVVVDDSRQLTAAIGVLGAIAGYLFGKISQREPISPEKEKKSSATV